MSAATTATEAATGTPRKRLTTSNIVIGIGIAFALVTLASGLSSALWPRHDPSEETREVFGGVSTPLYWAFYLILPALIVTGAILFSNRTRNWERGKPDNR